MREKKLHMLFIPLLAACMFLAAIFGYTYSVKQKMNPLLRRSRDWNFSQKWKISLQNVSIFIITMMIIH